MNSNIELSQTNLEDIDFKYKSVALERNNNFVGQYVHREDDERNLKFSMVLGGVAALLALVTLVLAFWFGWVDWTWFAIIHFGMVFLAILVAGLGVGWAFLSRKAKLTNEAPPAAAMTIALHVLSLIFAVYFLVSSFYLILYLRVHYCRLATYKTDQDTWDTYQINDWNLQKGWNFDRYVMYFMIAFGFLIAFCFAFLAYSSWSIFEDKYQLSRIALYAACVFAVLWGWLMIYWAEEARAWGDYPRVDNFFSQTTVTMLQILAIIGIVAAVVNIIINLIKERQLYFIFAVLMLILAIITLCFAGLLFRDYRRSQNSETWKATETLDLSNIDRDDLKGWCPKKYVEGCRKQDAAIVWEDKAKPQKFINPACGCAAKQYLSWPFYMLGIFTLFFVASLIVATGCNIFLSDTSEQLSNFNRVIGPAGIIALALALILCIAFGLYFFFRHENKIGTTSIDQAAFKNPEKNPDPKFNVVKREVLYTNQAPKLSASSKYNLSTEPKGLYDPNSTVCKDGADKCTFRVAILSQNAQFTTTAGPARTGTSQSRTIFFPGCTNISRNYKLFYGDQATIQTLLSTLRFTVDTVSQDAFAWVYIDQVKGADLDSYGTLKGESSNAQLSNAQDTCNTGLNTSFTDDQTCKGVCKATLDIGSTGTTTVYGQLYYIDTAGARVNHNPGTDAKIAVQDEEGIQIGSKGTIDSSGKYEISGVPVFKDSTYPVVISFMDSSDVFLTDNVDMVIPQGAGASVNAGDFRLLTKDGKVLAASDTTGLANQQFAQGTIKVQVVDSDNGNALSGIPVKLVRGSSFTGNILATETTDSNGNVSFQKPYGYYTTIIADDKYELDLERIYLQEKTNEVKAQVTPLEQEMDMKLGASISDPNSADLDFMMKVESDKGGKCTVSPINKYCAYAEHSGDVTSGNGSEFINVKRLSVAKYMTFVGRSSDFKASCPQYDAIKNAHYEELNWENVHRSVELKQLVINFFTNQAAVAIPASIKNSSLGASVIKAVTGNTTGNQVVQAISKEVQASIPQALPDSFIQGINTGLSEPYILPSQAGTVQEVSTETASNSSSTTSTTTESSASSATQASSSSKTSGSASTGTTTETSSSAATQSSGSTTPSTMTGLANEASVDAAEDTNSSATEAVPSGTGTNTRRRILTATNLPYLVSSCFTGYGKISEVKVNRSTSGEPTFTDCNVINGAGATTFDFNTFKYSLAELRKAQDAIAAKK